MHLWKNQKNSILNYGISILVCFSLISPLVSKKIGQISSGLLILIGITAITLAIGIKKVRIQLTKAESIFIIFSLIYLANLVMSFLSTSNMSNFGGKTDIFVYLLIPVFLFPLLHISNFKRSHLIYTISMISFISGALAIIEFTITNGRTGTLFHGQPIPYGNLSLCVGFICLAFMDSKNTNILNITLCFCALFGFIASLSSQTRGGFIAIPFILILLFLFKRDFLLKRSSIIATFVAITMFSIITVNSGMLSKVENRFKAAIGNTSSFVQDEDKQSSTGIRLSLWQIGIQGWLESPITGLGITKFYPYKENLIEQGSAPAYLLRFKHPHNEYVEILFTRGTVGLLLFILLLGLLSCFYFRRSADNVLAQSGILTICCYVIFSLTESFFSLHTSLQFFISFNSVLIFLLTLETNGSRIQNNAS